MTLNNRALLLCLPYIATPVTDCCTQVFNRPTILPVGSGQLVTRSTSRSQFSATSRLRQCYTLWRVYFLDCDELTWVVWWGCLELLWLVWMLTHSAFLRVTWMLLINNKIRQSVLRTYTALWPSFALAQFMCSCVTFFTILRESSKRLATWN